MKNLPLNMLRAFAAVYETGGIRPAARQLEVTHSSVSRFVHELEAWLDVALIDRRKEHRATAFTAEGEMLGRRVLACLAELESSLNAVKESRNANSVVIETTPSFAARWLLPRLGQFEEAFKWIELSVLVDQRIKPLEQTHVDFSIRMGKGPWKNADCQVLMDEMLYPVMTRDYWQSHGGGIGGSDDLNILNSARLLHDRDPATAWEKWRKQFGPAELDVSLGPRFNSSDLVLAAAEQGFGVALARHRLVVEKITNGALIAPFEPSVIEMGYAYWIVRQKSQRLTVAAQKVIDWLMQQTKPDATHGEEKFQSG